MPESRAMGDIDILIKECDRNKVKKLLTSNGFDCIKQNGPVYNYVKNNVLFEIHTKLINHYDEEPFCNAFDYAVFDGFEGTFDNNFHFAYLIAHTAHHFKFYGAGIKLIVDQALSQKLCNGVQYAAPFFVKYTGALLQNRVKRISLPAYFFASSRHCCAFLSLLKLYVPSAFKKHSVWRFLVNM